MKDSDSNEIKNQQEGALENDQVANNDEENITREKCLIIVFCLILLIFFIGWITMIIIGFICIIDQSNSICKHLSIEIAYMIFIIGLLPFLFCIYNFLFLKCKTYNPLNEELKI